MTASLMLLKMEARRNFGIWLFPIMAGLALWTASFELTPRAVLWSSVSSQMQYSVFLLGPLTGGLAAWMAGRNRRRGTEHLLRTTPYSPAVRDLTLFSATVLWCCLAYAVAASVVLLIASQRTAWGVPHWSPLLAGLLGVAANGALGYMVGYYLHSRFTGPLTAIVLLYAHLLPGALPGGALHLSPIGGNYAGDFLVFFDAPSGGGMPQVLWLLGIIGAALAVVSLKSRRTPLVASTLLVSVVVMVFGAVTLVRTDPYAAYAQPELLPYEAVCTEAHGIPVCVHPAYQAVLPETASVLAELAAPFVGLPGGIARMEQTHGFGALDRLEADGTLFFILPLGSVGGGYLAHSVTEALVGSGTDAQNAIRAWMVQRAGMDFRALHTLVYVEEEPERMQVWMDAAGAFAALAPEAQRAWLEENYAALRAGELTLEDLP